MKVLFIVITFVTFIIFFMEALIHFNIGKRGGQIKNISHKFIRISDEIIIHIPDKYEFIEIFLTVLIFSSISGLASSYIIKRHLY